MEVIILTVQIIDSIINKKIYKNNFSKYIRYIGGTLYNMTDICCIFYIKINKLIKCSNSNSIPYFYEQENKLYISNEHICKLLRLINTEESNNYQEKIKTLCQSFEHHVFEEE